MGAKNKGRNNAGNAAIAAATVIVAIAALYYLYFASYLGAVAQGGGALLVLAASGMIFRALFSLHGGYGVYLLSSKRGIGTVHRIARNHQRFWTSLALWGLVLGFGLLAWPLLKGRISKKLYAFGVVSAAFIMFFIVPFLSYSVIFINIPSLQRFTSTVQPLPSPAQYVGSVLGGNLITYALRAVTVLAGFTGYMFYLLALNSYNILVSVVASVSTASIAPLSNQVAGVAPLIPGLDTPLFAGIIALVVILIVHEMSHGVLASMLKVRLKSVGLLMFGLVPVGAFVEPEEKQVAKLPMIDQDKIMAAGVSSNFLLMLIFFVPMLLMIPYVVGHIYQQSVVITATIPGYPAHNVVPVGSRLVSWNGYMVSNLTSFESFAGNESPGSVINLVTSTGSYTFTSQKVNGTSRGLIGIDVGQVSKAVTPTFGDKTIYFFYTLFALLFMLNFLVAVVNLLPLPGLDGWRVYGASIKNRRFVRALTYIVLLMLLVNVLPWI
jgi:membrane-associated protease RseP (regulator of RpoE activity)